MKEASGEMSMTVVVIVAAILIVGILTASMPWISNFIKEKWDQMADDANTGASDASNAWG